MVGEPAAHEAPWGPHLANFARHSQKMLIQTSVSRPFGGGFERILRDIRKTCSSRPLHRDPLVEDLGEFCDTFAKNALQEVLLSSGLAKGVWDHTILPGGV